MYVCSISTSVSYWRPS